MELILPRELLNTLQGSSRNFYRCIATSVLECGCHRHIGGDCPGVIRLDMCRKCKEQINHPVVLNCGCVHCEPCAVCTLLSKPWARGTPAPELIEYFAPTDSEQQRRLLALIDRAIAEK